MIFEGLVGVAGRGSEPEIELVRAEGGGGGGVLVGREGLHGHRR